MNLNFDFSDKKRREAKDEIRRTLKVFFATSKVIEIRGLNVPRGRCRPCTYLGYFDDLETAVNAALELTFDLKAGGVYVVMNKLNPALLARSPNRLTAYPEKTTADADVIERIWLLIDCDPVRPAGISSNWSAFEKVSHVL